MSPARKWLLLGLALPLAGCGEAVPKGPEVKSVRTMVVDPRPDRRRSQRRRRGARRATRAISAFASAARWWRALRRRRRLRQEGRRAGAARRAGLPQQAEIGARPTSSPAEAVLIEAQGRRGAPAPAAGHRHRPRAPTTTPRSRTCARPKPSSTPPRPRCDLAKDQLSYAELRRRLRRHRHGGRRRARPGRQRRPDDRAPGAARPTRTPSSPSPSRPSAGPARRRADRRSSSIAAQQSRHLGRRRRARDLARSPIPPRAPIRSRSPSRTRPSRCGSAPASSAA